MEISPQLLSHRLQHIAGMMSQDSLHSFFGHTDMPIAVMFVQNTALGAQELAQELTSQFSLRAYTRHYFDQWPTIIDGWQRQVVAALEHSESNQEVSRTRLVRFEQLTKFLYDGASADSIQRYPDIVEAHLQMYDGQMSYECLLRKLTQALENLQYALDDIISLPDSQVVTESSVADFINNPIRSSQISQERRLFQQYLRQQRQVTMQQLLIYLRQRLHALLSELSFSYINLSQVEIDELIQRCDQRTDAGTSLFPEPNHMPAPSEPLADRDLVAKMLSFIDDEASTFLQIDHQAVARYFAHHDFRGYEESEHRICRLLALLQDIQTYILHPQSTLTSQSAVLTDPLFKLVQNCNATLAGFLKEGVQLYQLNTLFQKWLVDKPSTQEVENSQRKLRQLLERNNRLRLNYYLFLIHEASDYHNLILRQNHQGIHDSLNPEYFSLSKGAMPNASSINRYLSADAYNDEVDWRDEILPYLKTFRP